MDFPVTSAVRFLPYRVKEKNGRMLFPLHSTRFFRTIKSAADKKLHKRGVLTVKKRIIALSLVVLVLLFGCTACASSAADKSENSAAATYSTHALYGAEGGTVEMAETEEIASDTGGAGAPDVTTDSLPLDDRKIIRTTSLAVETTGFEDSAALLREAVGKAGGYIEYSSLYSGGSTRSANYTCRIPAAQYALFLESVQGAGSVVRTEESTEDATNQYIDLEARLKSLRTQEARLLEMMESSGSLEELLAVQEKLSDVQYRIESYTGQMKSLENRIDYCTVDIYLEEVETYTPIEPTFGERAGEAFHNMLNGIADGAQNFVLLLIYASPLLVIAAAILLVVLIVVKRRKRRAPPAMPVPPVSPQNTTGK